MKNTWRVSFILASIVASVFSLDGLRISPLHKSPRDLAGTKSAFETCRQTFFDETHESYWVDSPNYRCCTPGTVPDGAQYGGPWCSTGRLIALKTRACGFRYEYDDQANMPHQGVEWYCDRSAQPACLPAVTPALSDNATDPILAITRTFTPVFNPANTKATAAVPTGWPPAAVRTTSLQDSTAGIYSNDYLSNVMTAWNRNKTYLSYVTIDDTRTVDNLQRDLQKQLQDLDAVGRADVTPQIELDTHTLNLNQLITALRTPGSEAEQNLRAVARLMKNAGRRVLFRPLGEMNDGTHPYELGAIDAQKNHYNTPAQLAEAWNLIHRIVDEEGASNALFVFAPLAAETVAGASKITQVSQTLNLIPKGYIDVFGLNVYSRPGVAYGTQTPAARRTQKYLPFDYLAQPWLDLQQKTASVRDLPRMIGEMGASDQGTDADRAQWIHDTFTGAKADGFRSITYFNAPDDTKHWNLAPGTAAEQSLKAEIQNF